MDINGSNLIGRVCQLNYNCSGMLELSPMGELPKHVPFSTSPLSLRVGQTVLFRIVSRGQDVQAVHIRLESDVHQVEKMPEVTAVYADDLNSSLTTGMGVEKSQALHSEDVISFVLAQSHSRCFLRRMNQFRNSGQAEQVQLVIEAERTLDKLLGQSTLDGDAICRLARKCASWLNPPVLQTANPQRQSDHKSASCTEDQVHLQERIRKILIHALNHLDLQDPSTFEAMKAALLYMASLCQRLDEKCGFSSAMVATTFARKQAKQWLELKSLLADSRLKTLVSNEMPSQPPCPTVEDQSNPGPLRSITNTQDRMKEEADAARITSVEHEHEPKGRGHVAEFYDPTEKIKALPTVFQGKPVQLVCSECPFTVTSSWYFQHPKTLRQSVIAPQRGHDTCQQKVKNCYWKKQDGGPAERSIISNLRYCSHKRRRVQCALCGGTSMCIHGKQRHWCKECKHLCGRHRGPKRCWTLVSGGGNRETMRETEHCNYTLRAWTHGWTACNSEVFQGLAIRTSELSEFCLDKLMFFEMRPIASSIKQQNNIQYTNT